MSWSFSFITSADKIDEALDAAVASPDSTASEQVNQVAAAKDAISVLAKSQAAVREGRDYSVSANGHAEPNNGTGSQTLTVYVAEVQRTSTDA